MDIYRLIKSSYPLSSLSSPYWSSSSSPSSLHVRITSPSSSSSVVKAARVGWVGTMGYSFSKSLFIICFIIRITSLSSSSSVVKAAGVGWVGTMRFLFKALVHYLFHQNNVTIVFLIGGQSSGGGVGGDSGIPVQSLV